MNTPKEDALIFISWSGEASKRVALALRELVASAIQTANLSMSESDIDKGALA
jgi:D-arabinose 5-phosphate isomerase GutQ